MFPGIYLFLLGCPVCWHILFTVVSCEPLYFNLSVVISPLSFLNLSESSLLPGEASYWFVYFVDFSISQLLMWLFSIAFFFLLVSLIYFQSDLCYFLPSTKLKPHPSFSSSLRCEVWLLFWGFSCFLRWAFIAMNFFLWTAFTASHKF